MMFPNHFLSLQLFSAQGFLDLAGYYSQVFAVSWHISFFNELMLSLLESCQHLPSTSFGQAIPAQLPQGDALRMTLGCPAAP